MFCTGNASAIGALLFGSAYLNIDSVSAEAQNLTNTISDFKLSSQTQKDAFFNAILQSLQQPAGIASADVTATLVAAAVGAQQASAVAEGFAQVSISSFAVS